MRARWTALLLILLLLTGCTPLLEREYSTTEPHSSKFWESEAAGTLRAENYQDIVNDLLLLIGQHTDDAALRLYNFKDDVSVADTLERAAVEIQEQTPLGAYAVAYITSSSQPQRGYYEIAVQIGYRRTAEQIQAIVNATRPEAVSSLLESALDDSFIILDEAQNTSREQMKMFLTRLGFGSKIVITGDVTQIDLPDGKPSGLREAMRVLKNVEGIGICELTNADVVRHVMVQRIVEAYERDANRKPGKGTK